ncbi:transglutaminase-like domain-containing protein [Streptomyces daliensis]|uniref:Transglutaminase domain-containing protein n=1 Tax=Streptomyces daliensis TaxID=299421 RepID=A0A8T4IVN4_9ACTN|nr:transglutaminase domain-containing protein [Streptomyces daliensis]
MLPAERDFYLTQSVQDEPGAMADKLAQLPTGPDELALLVRRLLMHREETGSFGCALPDSRHRAEAEARCVDGILEIVAGLGGVRPTAPRRPADRFAGTCRDFALLHCALLRHSGTPARVRCGYATYFAPGFHDDHWVTEYAHPERGWTLCDPQVVPDRAEKGYELDFDPLDVPRERFLVAGEAWRLCRTGAADAATFGVSVLGLTGLWTVRANVVRDLAALNRAEVLPWDTWGVGDSEPASAPDDEELTVLDEAARIMAEGGFADLRELYLTTPSLRVPRTLTAHAAFAGDAGPGSRENAGA